MRALFSMRLCEALHLAATSPASLPLVGTLTTLSRLPNSHNLTPLHRNPLDSRWSAVQHRGYKVIGSDLRVGQIIERKGRIYQVLKAQHSMQGRGGAFMQVELRDTESGSKINERFHTDEALKRVFVEEKPMTYLYSDGDNIVLMEPETFEQVEVSKELFGKASVYLKDEMKVTLQLYDGRPMSASVPKRVTCRVAEAQTHVKGITATPQYKRVLLDNGLTILAPPFIVTGDAIVVDTSDNSYLTRAKE